MAVGRPKVKIIDGKKYCSVCKKLLPLGSFYKNKNKYSSKGYYFYSECKNCHCNRNETPRRIYQLLKKTGYSKMSKEEFIKWYKVQKRQCVYCGISEKDIKGLKWRWLTVKRLQVDRKDGKKGYEKGNLALACPLCNSVKNDYFSHQEMLFLGKTIKVILKHRQQKIVK